MCTNLHLHSNQLRKDEAIKPTLVKLWIGTWDNMGCEEIDETPAEQAQQKILWKKNFEARIHNEEGAQLAKKKYPNFIRDLQKLEYKMSPRKMYYS